MRHFCCALLFLFHFVCAESVFALSLSLELPEATGIVENTPKKVSFSIPNVFSEITQVDLTVVVSLLSGEGSLFTYFQHPTDFLGPFVSIDTDELVTPNFEITRSFNPFFQDEPVFDFLLGGQASFELMTLPRIISPLSNASLSSSSLNNSINENDIIIGPLPGPPGPIIPDPEFTLPPVISISSARLEIQGTPVPEPSSISLFLLGFLSLFGLRRFLPQKA